MVNDTSKYFGYNKLILAFRRNGTGGINHIHKAVGIDDSQPLP